MMWFANVATWKTSRPGRLVPAGRGVWRLVPDRWGPSVGKRAGNRIAAKRDASRVVGKRAANRVARWKSDMARHPADTVYKTVREAKTVCFDFSNEGAVKGGETLSNPVVTFAEVAGLPVLGVPAPNATDFMNSDGEEVEAGKGVVVKMTGGLAGRYNARCLCTAQPSGDLLECPMLLVITE